MQTNIRTLFFTAVFTGMALFSCKNDPGPGGQATITGKVQIRDYNSLCIYTGSTYYVPDYDVYIIYGDEASYGDRVRTGPDGTYQFKFMRTGKYKIYAYSDICGATTGPATEAIIQEVEVTNKKGTVEVADIVVVD